MGSIVLNRARVGRRAILAAGSVVKEEGENPPEVLAAGAPTEVKKELVEVDLLGRARVPGSPAPVLGANPVKTP